MEQHELGNKVSTWVSYFISGNLVFVDLLTYLNKYAPAIGVLLGVMTYLCNWYYTHKRYKIYKESLIE